MDRVPRQPATQSGGNRTRPVMPLERSRLVQWFRRASAIVRWGILVVIVGVGVAALVAVAIAALITLVDNSV